MRQASYIRKKQTIDMKKQLPAFFAILWSVAVMASHYVVNVGYYSEKISVFGNYLLAYVN